MVTVFNRKELLLTMDMKRQWEVRDILAAGGIQYTVKTTDLQSASVLGSSRARTGSFGVDRSFSYEYKIYVRKKDYEAALALIK